MLTAWIYGWEYYESIYPCAQVERSQQLGLQSTKILKPLVTDFLGVIVIFHLCVTAVTVCWVMTAATTPSAVSEHVLYRLRTEAAHATHPEQELADQREHLHPAGGRITVWAIINWDCYC